MGNGLSFRSREYNEKNPYKKLCFHLYNPSLSNILRLYPFHIWEGIIINRYCLKFIPYDNISLLFSIVLHLQGVLNVSLDHGIKGEMIREYLTIGAKDESEHKRKS